MPEEPLDPYVALKAIKAFAKAALVNDEPTLHGQELILREILNVCEQAVPKKARGKRSARPAGEGE